MPFLSSQRSLNSPVKNDSKPPSQPTENSRKPRKEKRRRPQPTLEDDASGTSSGRGSLMRRMASIFRPKRKPPAPASNPTGAISSRNYNAIGCMYIAPDRHRPQGGPVESDTYDESDDDDIRCPSGLGSAVSLTTPPPLSSPLPPIQPDLNATDNLKVTDASDAPSVGIHSGPRANSSPNLLRSLSQKVKNKLRRRGSTSSHKKPQVRHS